MRRNRSLFWQLALLMFSTSTNSNTIFALPAHENIQVNKNGEPVDAPTNGAKSDSPIVALPVGYTTTRKPRIEWRSEVNDSYHVRVTAGESTASAVLWDSGIVVSNDTFTTAVQSLPAETTLYTHVRVHTSTGWTDWSSRSAPFRIKLVPQPTGVLVTYDLNYSRELAATEAFGHAHLVSVLQGILNREEPQLFVHFVRAKKMPQGVDAYWLDRLREPEGWLKNVTLEPVADIVALITRFRSSIDGVVLWDPAVNATSNVASTVAGADNLIPVRYDLSAGSLYNQLVTSGPRLPVRVNLVGKFTGSGTIPDTLRESTGSTKCDAYIWAVEKYLKSGRSNPGVMGYYIDGYWINKAAGNEQIHTLTNHDYVVAKKGFFWDLSPWADEVPVDDPGQPLGSDAGTLKEIYLASYLAMEEKGFSHTAGFTPWSFKYSDFRGAGSKHGGVDTEWETVRILSAYNSYLDADAIGPSPLANASVYTHMPLPDRYSQPVPPMPEELRREGLLSESNSVTTATYILHYVGDYDSAAWISTMLPSFWDEPARGTVDMAWALNPNLSDRATMFFEYAYRTRTASDHFMAGDSGAGYINPTQLLPPRSPSSLPSAVGSWQKHCRHYYQAFGMDFTGFVINGLSGIVGPVAEQIYQAFSANGIIIQGGMNHADVHLEGDMPVFVQNSDLSGVATAGAETIHTHVKPDELRFLMFRSILRPVSYYSELNRLLKSSRPDLNYVFCSPNEFAYLARLHLGSENNHLASYPFDTVPQSLKAGISYPAEIAVRNDGWDTWTGGAGGTYGLLLKFSDDQFTSPTFYSLPRDVLPGDSIMLHVNIATGPTVGLHSMVYQMAGNNGANGFVGEGDAAFVRPLEILP